MTICLGNLKGPETTMVAVHPLLGTPLKLSLELLSHQGWTHNSLLIFSESPHSTHFLWWNWKPCLNCLLLFLQNGCWFPKWCTHIFFLPTWVSIDSQASIFSELPCWEASVTVSRPWLRPCLSQPPCPLFPPLLPKLQLQCLDVTRLSLHYMLGFAEDALPSSLLQATSPTPLTLVVRYHLTV